MKYRPSKASKDAERAVKDPLIAEHNAMGLKFRTKEISLSEWEIFKKDWESRRATAMGDVLKNRVYEEDNDEQ